LKSCLSPFFGAKKGALVPRAPRNTQLGYAYHVINRGNGQAKVFHQPQDYEVFLDLLVAARQRQPIKLFAFCLMPNHFHLVVEPETTPALSRFMQWLMTTHVRRYHKYYKSSGHIWQGRFKSFPIQLDGHLLIVQRYVRQNPVRAGLVTNEEQWPWSSVTRSDLVDRSPIENSDKIDSLSTVQIQELRECVNRQRPFGTLEWRRAID
jgi:REP-associated tyrosine transposase